MPARPLLHCAANTIRALPSEQSSQELCKHERPEHSCGKRKAWVTKRPSKECPVSALKTIRTENLGESKAVPGMCVRAVVGSLPARASSSQELCKHDLPKASCGKHNA